MRRIKINYYLIAKDKRFTHDERDRYHSFNDMPAVIYNNGVKVWYTNGVINREKGPAVLLPNLIEVYYDFGRFVDVRINKLRNKNGNILDERGYFHSFNDEPARILIDGTKEWYKHGKKHRDNDLPAVIWYDGEKSWYINGEKIK